MPVVPPRPPSTLTPVSTFWLTPPLLQPDMRTFRFLTPPSSRLPMISRACLKVVIGTVWFVGRPATTTFLSMAPTSSTLTGVSSEAFREPSSVWVRR